MLTFEIMGVVALWVLWGNTALIALAALKRVGALLGKARQLRGAELGTVTSPGALGSFIVQQLGRQKGGGRALLWHDRSYATRVHGGELALAGGERLTLAEGAACDLWLSADRVDRAFAEGESDFAEHFPDAQKFRGAPRTLSVDIMKGQRVFVVREAGAPALVATMNPAGWCRRRALFGVLVVLALLAAAGACTWLALTEPVFESALSKLGALLGLVFFLLVLPAGTALRDFLRYPSERIVRGESRAPGEPSAEPARVVA